MEKQIEILRGIIQESDLYEKYFKCRKEKWDELCVAMDTIEDTFLAVDFFIQNGLRDDIGEKYLKLYGVFQAIYLQQDAIKSLHTILRNSFLQSQLKKWSKYRKCGWEKIRSYRNVIVGHPTKCTSFKKNDTKRTFVNRTSIEDSCKKIKIMLCSKEKSVFKNIDIYSLTAQYYKDALKILEDITKTFKIWYT